MRRIDLEALAENPWKLIGKDWMLISAGRLESHNSMTASWGGFGVLWRRNVTFVFVRPTRFTFDFMEREPLYVLSFFEEKHRGILDYCGSRSGRNEKKTENAGLSIRPLDIDGTPTVGFAEARLTLACRKLYSQDLDPARFLDAGIEGLYPNRDYHRMYVGEILYCFLSESAS